MRLITNDEQLLAHLPNIVSTVRSERPFFERLAPQLDLAERWVVETFTSPSLHDELANSPDHENLRTILRRLIAADAMRRAIPAMDLVLTPNGFGVVSTQNLAPASRARVEALMASMRTAIDECIAALLPALARCSGWLGSAQARWFGATLFPFPDIVNVVGQGDAPTKWEAYKKMRQTIIGLEASLADEWLSPELLSALRRENLRGTLSDERRAVVGHTRSQLIAYLRDGSFSSRRLADIVNYIRQRPGDFPEWHGSEVAGLFAPPVFRNYKRSGGYFF